LKNTEKKRDGGALRTYKKRRKNFSNRDSNSHKANATKKNKKLKNKNKIIKRHSQMKIKNLCSPFLDYMYQ